MKLLKFNKFNKRVFKTINNRNISENKSKLSDFLQQRLRFAEMRIARL